ncbi:MAG TPA: thrombospondin type 3 repeat-containing protein, partial [Candidatus Hydrogenedentes bacterium]|nr:thrombospondin type 3 repeat-containing protein [Candidatus Hydrogenedentota bacterium]
RTFRLILSNPSGCELPPTGNNPATITILDDDLDNDGDGLSDYDEIHAVYGYVTDPFNPDTDGDGYTDYEEIMVLIHGIKSDPTQFTAIPALSVPYFTMRSGPCPRR